MQGKVIMVGVIGHPNETVDISSEFVQRRRL